MSLQAEAEQVELEGMPEPPSEAPTDKRGYQALLETALASCLTGGRLTEQSDGVLAVRPAGG